MTPNLGNLIVFSASNILLFMSDLVVDDPVGLITFARFFIQCIRHTRVLVNQRRDFWM